MWARERGRAQAFQEWCTCRPLSRSAARLSLHTGARQRILGPPGIGTEQRGELHQAIAHPRAAGLPCGSTARFSLQLRVGAGDHRGFNRFPVSLPWFEMGALGAPIRMHVAERVARTRCFSFACGCSTSPQHLHAANGSLRRREPPRQLQLWARVWNLESRGPDFPLSCACTVTNLISHASMCVLDRGFLRHAPQHLYKDTRPMTKKILASPPLYMKPPRPGCRARSAWRATTKRACALLGAPRWQTPLRGALDMGLIASGGWRSATTNARRRPVIFAC